MRAILIMLSMHLVHVCVCLFCVHIDICVFSILMYMYIDMFLYSAIYVYKHGAREAEQDSVLVPSREQVDRGFAWIPEPKVRGLGLAV